MSRKPDNHYRARISYNISQLRKGSIIGVTAHPSKFDPNCNEGIALSVLTNYKTDTANFADFDGIQSNDLDKYKNFYHEKFINEQHNYRYWHDTFFILPFYKYKDQQNKEISGATMILDEFRKFEDRQDPYQNLMNAHKKILVNDFDTFLALWRNNHNQYTTIYYRAKIIKFSDSAITVKFIDNTEQILPIYVDINGYQLPTVIRKYSIKNSFQLDKLLKRKHYSMMDEFKMQSQIKCAFNELREFRVYPCKHYIWMCQCKICKRHEIPKILKTKCEIKNCGGIISGLRSV